MRRIVIGFFAVVLSSLSAFAQVSTQPPPQGTATQTATKDSQAVSVLDQALSAAGGAAAIKAVTDYTAIGNITYYMHNGHDVQGTVQVLGGPRGQVRVDSTLPSGTRSWAIDQGLPTRKAEDGTITKVPAGPIPSSNALPYRAPRFPNSITFPYKQLLTVLNSPAFNLSYKGLVQLDGHSVYELEAQRVPPQHASSPDPIAKLNALDFFIDASTLQLAMVQDMATRGTVHQVRYSTFVTTNGVLVPFSIADQLGNQSTWTIQLSQISFNNGLQDSAFVIQ